MSKQTTIGIVTPCFNEALVLPTTIEKLTGVMDLMVKNGDISVKSFICFVDDGSKDNTWDIIEEGVRNNALIKGIKLSTNVGHQNALLAGLLTYKDSADALISIDADLQDDIDVLKTMVLKFNSGTNVVYAVRKERKTDSFFKRNTALFFYKLMKLMHVNIVYNHSDYRLLSNKVLTELEKFGEVNLFLRGIIPSIGFSNDIVYYNRLERYAGKSKYPFKRCFHLHGMGSLHLVIFL